MKIERLEAVVKGVFCISYRLAHTGKRMTHISVLDLSLITEGGDAAQALSNTRDLARHAEAWGYRRYWVAEHHNLPGIASAATAVVIGHVASSTSTIRVGAGGIMLPNHAPLVIAEQFGTLEALYPGRIDLGIGRAPGTDRMTAYALRRNLSGDVDQCISRVREWHAAGVSHLVIQPIPPRDGMRFFAREIMPAFKERA